MGRPIYGVPQMGWIMQLNAVLIREMISLYHASMLTYTVYKKMHIDPITTLVRDGNPISTISPTISQPPSSEPISTSSIQFSSPSASRQRLQPASKHHLQVYLSTVFKCTCAPSPASSQSAVGHHLWPTPIKDTCEVDLGIEID